MAVLSKVGDTNPFLHVSMQKGDKVFAESDAMVMMDANLELVGRMQGGVVNALARRIANDESMFLQELTAPNGPGDALFAPASPGDMEILEVGGTQYIVNDGAFVLCTENVSLETKFQNPFNALFSGTGGFIISRTTGTGQVVVAGLGAIFSIDVEPGKDIIVDNFHVVAWDSRLDYKPSISTAKSGGFFQNMIESQLTGEGIVTRFSGTGKVYICSRNPKSFADFVRGMNSPKTNKASGSGLFGN